MWQALLSSLTIAPFIFILDFVCIVAHIVIWTLRMKPSTKLGVISRGTFLFQPSLFFESFLTISYKEHALQIFAEIYRYAICLVWLCSWEYSFVDRLQEAIISKDITGTTLLDASRALGILRSTLHAYNKSVAEVSSSSLLLGTTWCIAVSL